MLFFSYFLVKVALSEKSRQVAEERDTSSGIPSPAADNCDLLLNPPSTADNCDLLLAIDTFNLSHYVRQELLRSISSQLNCEPNNYQ